MKRTTLVVGLGLVLLALVNNPQSLWSFSPAAQLTHGPVVGAVTENAARVFVRTSAGASVKIRYGRMADLSDAVESAVQQTGAEQDFATIIPLTDLLSDTVYFLNIVVDNVAQRTAPFPQFKTFPPRDARVSFKFAYVSDSSVKPGEIPQTFFYAGQEQPAFVILGGDFPHGKYVDPEAKRSYFKAMYDPDTSPSIQTFVNDILYRYPVAHMWDNHDYGMPSDKRYPLKAVSLQVLAEFFPTYPMTQYGDWQKFSYAQADFFLLDSRSQRDPNRTPDGPEKSMLDGDNLGAAGQLDWLKKNLKQSTARWKFILSPVPFNPTAKPKTSWGAFLYERASLLEFIKQNRIHGVISLPGDLHIGAIDNGTNSGMPEMLVPDANGASCQSTRDPGTWSEGRYGAKPGPCNGYGLVTVSAQPGQVTLEIKDADGVTRLKYKVK